MRTLISAKVTIDGGDWQDLKKIMPEWVINLLERRIDLSIVEKIKNGTRTWITKASSGEDVDLISKSGNWKENQTASYGFDQNHSCKRRKN